MKEIHILIIVALLFCFTLQVGAQRYTNPVIPGDFPDPSVIRVGSEYYAASTTGDWAPQFSLLRSTDLVNWKVISSVFDSKPAWAKGDFWAPEIVNDNGKFRVYYSARRDEGKDKKGTLCVAVAIADKPSGPYQDKGPIVCQEMGSIDASFARDEHGQPFLIWKEDGNDRQQSTWLYAQQLDADGTRLTGKPKKLFRNTDAWEKHVIEGPYVMRKDDWFYLFYSGNACCGRSCNYALGVARSRKLLGPWEKDPLNPILPANKAWQCPGHGTIVNTVDGRSFLLYHAYQNTPAAFNIGREALLDQVTFENGWATVNSARGPSGEANVPESGTRQRQFDLNDEFNTGLSPAWNYPLFDSGNFRSEDGFLVAAPPANSEVVLAERTISGNYTASARIVIPENVAAGSFVGLSAYGWRQNAVGISVGSGQIFTWKRDRKPQVQVSNAPVVRTHDSIILRMRVKDGESFSFAFSTDEGKNWQQLGEAISKNDIEGARIALMAGGSPRTARFDWVHVTQD